MRKFLRKIKALLLGRHLANAGSTQKLRLLFSGKTNGIYFKELLEAEVANNVIADAIKAGTPFIASRLGGTEIKLINNYITKNISDYHKWDAELVEEGFTHSGIFPQNDDVFDEFAATYLSAMRDVDLMGVWNNLGEDFLLKTINPEIELCALKDLEPFFHKRPWSLNLEGKRVLVIHPFVDTIQRQYQKRKQLFSNNLLPEFTLITVKAVQSLSGHDLRFRNWGEALRWMENEICKIEFDVAVIGAGAYGLPLAAFIKKMNKTAIHLGGASQLLFGIKGERWNHIPGYPELMNSYWENAGNDESPEVGMLVDGYGPYWSKQ